ncbi:anti-sigma-F factor Fin family protein [Tuberibacillus sp. Marseille-P3662]|uniref:anti-sigma-F factor Fin family protein n=1 Tax=Tuberibacillus sp. Marseille-P3662 TaxID=1965358 RepID=UPI000A1CCCE3|nr:anti-sigma-F factor Fin family protein [Tuberibacillus sp. Marseille-P3662]
MDIFYNCRHCGVGIGQINGQRFSTHQLGFDQLSSEDRQDMVQYDQLGNVHVSAICEDCQEALERNPHFHELDSFIQ